MKLAKGSSEEQRPGTSVFGALDHRRTGRGVAGPKELGACVKLTPRGSSPGGPALRFAGLPTCVECAVRDVEARHSLEFDDEIRRTIPVGDRRRHPLGVGPEALAVEHGAHGS